MAYMDQQGATKFIGYQEYASFKTQEYPENISVLSLDEETGILSFDSVIKSKDLADSSSCLFGKSTPILLRIYDQEPGNPALRFSGVFTGKEKACYPYPESRYSSLNELSFNGSTPVIKELVNYTD